MTAAAKPIGPAISIVKSTTSAFRAKCAEDRTQRGASAWSRVPWAPHIEGDTVLCCIDVLRLLDVPLIGLKSLKVVLHVVESLSALGNAHPSKRHQKIDLHLRSPSGTLVSVVVVVWTWSGVTGVDAMSRAVSRSYLRPGCVVLSKRQCLHSRRTFFAPCQRGNRTRQCDYTV